MAYQTLYRKYRPQTFKDVVGQKNIVKVLSNAIINNKIAHAYLFCGPRGTGKTSMAKIFAKIVNCQNLNGVEPCCKCVCCKQIESKNFLDIIEIDAASNNGVDEIREIKNKVNLAPNSGRYKVYIIDEVHMLSIGAFNALLKTLEEPPAHIIFILATTEPHKLPITVISRCQRFDFKKFLNEELEEQLRKICTMENLNIPNEILKEIAILSDGGMRDAIGLLDQLSLYQSEELTVSDLYQLSGTLSTANELEFLEKYFNSNISKCLEMLHSYEAEGKNFSKITNDFLYLLEQILKYKVIDNYENSNDINLKEKYLQLANLTSKEKIYNLISKISDTIKNIKNTSNPRILLEMIFLMEYSDKNDIKKSNIVSPEPVSINTNVDIVQEKKIVEDKVSKVKEDLRKEVVESKYKNFSLSREQVEILKNVRINNALATADKSVLSLYKQKIPLLLEYMFDDNYSSIVCNLQDNELRVAGVNNIIISVEYSSTVELLNEKLYLLDELLSKIFEANIKAIIVSNSDWLNIKNEYVQDKKSNKIYQYMEEEDYYEELSQIKNNENSDLEGIFGSSIDDIIEVR